MAENIALLLFGALLGVALREGIASLGRKSRRKKLARLCTQHLEQIQQALSDHVGTEDGKAVFSDTQYSEIVGGDFLYDLIINNIDAFEKGSAIERTITFFHHYKVNMRTIQSRLKKSSDGQAWLTETTYRGLMDYLRDAIAELDRLG